ncbi:6-aminohexanoate-dimer hydrolase [Pseudomonas sp. FH4]|uniref:CubicO group peptidase, beta-lactamase class C family n=1 Tax=Pseudomonas brenneri TaxID=129817 RepID=A0A5B2V5V6_9PSED|nr:MULTISPECIES: serine hydrolase domain-containing protein [Pseudomonas]ETK17807.1 6-aminohexanoate-dimer hydrolase [Pseudomonas sp. FH4]KAA2233559.1 serine hydrolase [Pseudomonas brenneri]MBF8003476.1 serine hydrolase [Pseudomonas brenneri]TWR82207.1 serine hydrolase [Pseudomonas brenneri]WJM88815.1 serine hydrolase [Pseudomonas brenneri]
MTSLPLRRARPSQQRVSARGVSDFIDAVNAAGLQLHSFMLYRDGAVVAEAFWAPYHAARLHVQHSATKSWIAMAVGLLVDDGVLSLDAKVVDFFAADCPSSISANLAAMTVRDLLTMRTGHRQGISGGAWRGRSDSWVKLFLSEPVEDPPGQRFIYSSASSFMLSAIVSVVSGQTAFDLCNARIFQPMGMGPIEWDLAPGGFNTGGNGLSCRTEDLLKFGVLHLQQGNWEGQQLLSREWVAEATRGQVDDVWMGAFDGKRYLGRDESSDAGITRREGYGYQWWMTQHGGYYASGVFGQQCIVLPRHNAVIAFTAGLPLGERRLHSLLWEHLLPALGVPTDGAVDAELAALLAHQQRPVMSGASHSPRQAEFSGTFVIEANEDQVNEVRLQFGSEHCDFYLTDPRGTHCIRAGLADGIESQTSMTGHYLHHQYQPELTPVVAQARWSDDGVLCMTWQFVETAFCDQVTCRIEHGILSVDRSVNVNAGPLQRPTLTGHPTIALQESP